MATGPQRPQAVMPVVRGRGVRGCVKRCADQHNGADAVDRVMQAARHRAEPGRRPLDVVAQQAGPQARPGTRRTPPRAHSCPDRRLTRNSRAAGRRRKTASRSACGGRDHRTGPGRRLNPTLPSTCSRRRQNRRICAAMTVTSSRLQTLQNGGCVRAGVGRALVTECHPALGTIPRGSPAVCAYANPWSGDSEGADLPIRRGHGAKEARAGLQSRCGGRRKGHARTRAASQASASGALSSTVM